MDEKDIFKKYAEIEILRKKGQFKKAQARIPELEQLGPEAAIMAHLLQNDIKRVQGESQSVSVEEFEDFLNQVKEFNNPYLTLYAYEKAALGLTYWDLNKFDTYIKHGEEIYNSLPNPLEKLSPLQAVLIIAYLGFLYWNAAHTGNTEMIDEVVDRLRIISESQEQVVITSSYFLIHSTNEVIVNREGDQTLELLKQGVNISDRHGWHYTSANARYKLYFHYTRTETPQLQLDLMKEIVQFNSKIDPGWQYPVSMMQLIRLLIETGQQDGVSSYLDEVVDYVSTHGYDRTNFTVDLIKTRYYGYRKQWKNAIPHLIKTIEFYEHRKDIDQNIQNQNLMHFHNLLRKNYHLIGDIQSCLHHSQKSLHYAIETGNEARIAVGHYNAGKSLCMAGKFDEGISHYEKAIALVRQKYESSPSKVIQLVRYLFTYFLAISEARDQADARAILQEIKALQTDIHPETQNIAILAEAIYLKAGRRARDKIQAQDMLEDCLDKNWSEEIRRIVLINYCELLIFEIEAMDDDFMLDKCENIIKQMVKEAKQQEAVSYLVESLLLLTKVQMIKGEYTLAEQTITRAETEAINLGGPTLIAKIDKFKPKFYDNLKKLSNTSTEVTSIRDRMQKMELKNYIAKVKSLVDFDDFA